MEGALLTAVRNRVRNTESGKAGVESWSERQSDSLWEPSSTSLLRLCLGSCSFRFSTAAYCILSLPVRAQLHLPPQTVPGVLLIQVFHCSLLYSVPACESPAPPPSSDCSWGLAHSGFPLQLTVFCPCLWEPSSTSLLRLFLGSCSFRFSTAAYCILSLPVRAQLHLPPQTVPGVLLIQVFHCSLLYSVPACESPAPPPSSDCSWGLAHSGFPLQLTVFCPCLWEPSSTSLLRLFLGSCSFRFSTAAYCILSLPVRAQLHLPPQTVPGVLLIQVFHCSLLYSVPACESPAPPPSSDCSWGLAHSGFPLQLTVFCPCLWEPSSTSLLRLFLGSCSFRFSTAAYSILFLPVRAQLHLPPQTVPGVLLIQVFHCSLLYSVPACAAGSYGGTVMSMASFPVAST